MNVPAAFLSVLTACVLAVGAVGCDQSGSSTAGGGASAEKPLIGLSLATLQEARWQKDKDLFTARAQELGATVQAQSANDDDAAQLQQVKAMLTSGVRALVIIPHNGEMMAAAVKEARQDKVPVIAYDRMIMNCDLDLYLSFDNVRVGEEQAKYLLSKLPGGKGKIVRIYGAPTDNNAKLFKAGQDKVLKPAIDHKDVEVIHEDWAENWTPANAKRITEAAITAHGKENVHAVLASNDGTAGGAIQALLSEGIAGKVIVTGQDADLVACQRIAQGTQSMTIYKPLKVLATRSAEAAVALAKGEKPQTNATVPNGQKDVPSILCDVVTVTRDNLLDTVIKDGFLSYDDVFRDVPQAQRPPRPQ